MKQIKAKFKAERLDAELGILWGYASVADITDLQGDVIPQDELIAAVYAFIEGYYAGKTAIKVNHDEAAAAVLVESTFHVLGTNVAWFVGVKLLDEALRDAARSGDISGFSIGGRAEDEEEE